MPKPAESIENGSFWSVGCKGSQWLAWLMVTHVFVRRRKVLGKGAKVSRTTEEEKRWQK